MIKRQRQHRILALALGMFLAFLGSDLARAGSEKAGTTAANFLSLGAGPRILGMGGATLGLGDDVVAGSWNPAALGFMQQGALTVSHASLDEESMLEWVGMGGRIGRAGTYWSLSGVYQGGESFEGRDAANNPTGEFSASSMAFGLHLSQKIGPMFTVGLGVKSVHERLADVTGSGVTLDGGVMFRHGMLGVGFAAQNIGGTMKYEGAAYEFPANYGLGFGLTHWKTGLSLAVDANFPSAYYSDIRTGAEWRWKQLVALRAGYRHEMGASDDPLSGPTFGLGAGTNGFWFDYGFLLSPTESGEHRLAITFFPSAWSGLGSDPFGQGSMPTEFGSEPALVGPPAPRK